ncbi:hypothetical protein DAEQUDRAFT_440565 [Daedalea quercina L-15889]|uniref:Uncharacterized protein n=1 Tax=Daedalea quercina L-15889 TaxID=1314783 RepID=A0A165NC15_9APHY|nr:hypothetical protein DAEQUDRAFT_440565 [Daedalea quercina L-15889]
MRLCRTSRTRARMRMMRKGPAPIAPPNRAQGNPLASPTHLVPSTSRLPAADPGPITRPVAPIAPIARPSGDASGSGSTSPSRRSPSPKGVLGSSALAADDDEVVQAPNRRTVAPGPVGGGWGSPRSSLPDVRPPWGPPGAPSGFGATRPLPPVGHPIWTSNHEWQPSTPFFTNAFTAHNPSPPHSGS